MQIQECTMTDVTKLAVLNKQLIDDEKSDNPMNINELENRMKGFLETDYSAYFFIEDSQIIGYALIRNTSNPVYLRQFLIDRNYRKQHYGTQAFEMLLRYLNIKEIDLEVLPWNKNGLARIECQLWHDYVEGTETRSENWRKDLYEKSIWNELYYLSSIGLCKFGFGSIVSFWNRADYIRCSNKRMDRFAKCHSLGDYMYFMGHCKLVYYSICKEKIQF